MTTSSLSQPESAPHGLAAFAAGETRRGPREPRKPAAAPPPHPPLTAAAPVAAETASEQVPSVVGRARQPKAQPASLPSSSRSVMIGVRVRSEVDKHLVRVTTDLKLDHDLVTSRTEILEMLVWEDAQSTEQFAERLRRFRQENPAEGRRF